MRDNLVTMRWGLVALLATCGCNWLLGLQSFPDAHPGDADLADAPPLHPCKGRMPAPFFCADFDEPTPTIYVDGTPSSLDLTANDVTVSLRAPSTTGPSALWIDSAGGTFAIKLAGTTAFKVLTATFDFRIGARSTMLAGPSDTGLMRLAGQNPPALNSCYANFVLDEGMPTLRINGACPDNPNTDFSKGALPSDWIHVELVMDFSVPKAAIAINGGTPIPRSFVGPPPGALVPELQIGIDGTGHEGLSVGYDDISIVGSN